MSYINDRTRLEHKKVEDIYEKYINIHIVECNYNIIKYSKMSYIIK